MKRFLFSVCCFCVLAVCLQAQQADWAKFGRYEQANKEIKEPVKVVFMGNSVTEGWARRRPEFFDRHSFVGRGISGQTSCQMLVRFRRDVIDLHPEAVAILAGTNDVAQNIGEISLENILGNIRSMCELAQVNGIQVILCSVLPAYRFKWRPELEPAEKIIRLNELIRQYADEKEFPYVDYHTAMKDERNGLPEKYSSDGVHPNEEGYRVMEEAVLKIICGMGLADD